MADGGPVAGSDAGFRAALLEAVTGDGGIGGWGAAVSHAVVAVDGTVRQVALAARLTHIAVGPRVALVIWIGAFLVNTFVASDACHH